MKLYAALLLSLFSTMLYAQAAPMASVEQVKLAIEKQIPEANAWSMQINPMGNRFYQVNVAKGVNHPKPTVFVVMADDKQQDFTILGTVIYHTGLGENRCYFTSTVDKTCNILNKDGTLQSTSSYQNNLLHGMETLYENQAISAQIMYEKGLKHGLFIAYFGEHPRTTETRSTYQHGKRLGPSVVTSKGMTRTQGYAGYGLTDNLSLAHHNNGVPSNILGTQSEYINQGYFFYSNGQIARLFIANPKKNPDNPYEILFPSLQETHWYPNGQMAIQVRHDNNGKKLEENYWNEQGKAIDTEPNMQPYREKWLVD